MRFRKKSFTGAVILAAAMAIVPLLGPPAGAVNSNYTSNRAPLYSTPYVQLPLGSIRARGWLLKQLELQRDGLTGNAESVYPELGSNSAWLGGTAPDSDWERPTYYLRGVIPLAYTLNDSTLKTRAQKWVDWAISSQKADGYFGPSNGDWWARMPMLIALEDYYDATGDTRIMQFLLKYFQYQNNNTPNGLGYWGAARAADNILAVMWLYNKTGDSFLLTLMDKIRNLTEDWTTALTNGSFGDNHGVNVAEGFKMPPVWYQKSLDTRDRDAFMLGHNNGMRLHGQPHYMLSCTEFLAGKSSLQGPEQCAVVDRIFSDGVAMMILGEPKIGDITERIAFNALPGTVSKTYRQQAYYVIPNEAQILFGSKGIYGQDYEDGLCPSWQSGWPCCCFNWHMGWPRFTMYSWAATDNNGLAIFTYAPTEVTAKVGSGVTVKFVEDTSYPFEEQVRLTLTTPQAVQFPLKVRIPEWCANPVVKVNGVVQGGATALTFFTIDRTWSSGDTVTLDFPMSIKLTTQYNNSIAVERGPLVYSLKIGENWVKRLAKTVNGLDFGEYEVKPTTSWNYGLVIDRENPAASIIVNKGPMPANPFDQATTPVTLTARAKKVPTWTMASNGLPEEVPAGPLGQTSTPEDPVTLVPFGAENLRITYFPEIPISPYASGLTGEYFDNINLTTLMLTRVDREINFSWSSGSPDPSIGADTFSVRWTGQIRPRYSQTYTFYVASDDGRRLWVNNQLIIDKWLDGSGTYSGTIALTAGRWYDIKLEYYENTGSASAKLEWSSASQAREVVPYTCLRPAIAASLEVLYNFDETTGTTAFDSSGNGRNGTLVNGPVWTAGRMGNAVGLDGIDDYVAVPDVAEAGAFSVATWVKIDALSNARNAIVQCNGLEPGDAAIAILNTGEIAFSLIGNTAGEHESNYRFAPSDFTQWKHIAVVYDSAAKTVRFYVDGTLDAVRSYTTARTALLYGMRVGAWDVGSRNLDGKLDDFRIYTRALTDAEVAALGSSGVVHGLKGEYFDNADLTGLKLTRTDPNVNFDWGAGSPDPSIAPDTFSVRWTGQIMPRYSEPYTFYTTSDDGVRLWVNAKLLIDNWTVHTATVDTGTMGLAAGRKYDIKMEYFENTANAVAKLEWSSASQPREVVPQNCLYPAAGCPNPTVAWYKFDETSGTTAYDSTGNGKHGTLVGGCTWVAGKIGNAVNLNGSTGHVSLPSGIVQSCDDFTIAAWVKIDNPTALSRIFDFGTGTTVNMYLTPRSDTGTARFGITSGSGGEQRITGSSALLSTVWTHVAVTLAGSVGILYVDAAEVARSANMTLKPSSLGNTSKNYIGRSQYSADPYLDGQIDDFRIYSRALTAAEIGAMAASTPENCIGFLKKNGTLSSLVLVVDKVVTAALDDCFYIQCPEPGHTSCGIRVVSAVPQTAGAGVTIRGVLRKYTNDELAMLPIGIVPGIAASIPQAAGCANKHVGGGTQGIAQGPDGGTGLNLVGVLQTTWGRAASVVPGESMVIDDGSGCPVKVIGPTGSAVDGDYVRVTGVSSFEKSGEAHMKTLRTRSSDDVIVMSR